MTSSADNGSVEDSSLAECRASMKQYQSRLPKFGHHTLWLDLEDASNDTHSVSGTEVTIIDADETGLELKSEGCWNDSTARLLRNLKPKSDNSTRLILISNPPEFAGLSFPIRDLVGVLGLHYDIEPEFFEDIYDDAINSINYPGLKFGYYLDLNSLNSNVDLEVVKRSLNVDIQPLGNTWCCLGPRVLIKIIEPVDLLPGKRVVLVFFEPERFYEMTNPYGLTAVDIGAIGRRPIHRHQIIRYKCVRRPGGFQKPQNGLPTLKNSLFNAILNGPDCLDLESISSNPAELLRPFWNVYEEHLEQLTRQISHKHQEWWRNRVRKETDVFKPITDETMYTEWAKFLKDIQLVSRSLSRYEAYLKRFSSKADLRATISKCKARGIIMRAQELEAFIRDSHLSLQGSRRSLAQADSASRVTFVAFVFLLLSLVTSIFGMNISELTGVGVSWSTFFITVAVMAVLTIAVCAYLWRNLVKGVVNKLRPFS